jgi:3-isopropylmalate dehydratase small subunit
VVLAHGLCSSPDALACCFVPLSHAHGRAANGEAYPFKIDEFRKHCLLNGLDDIGLTLAKSDLINTFEKRYLAAQPWINGIGLKAVAR